MVNSLEEINRSMNNVTMTLRLVWVDPAPSTSRSHSIRCVCSDNTRSIRLTLWGFTDEVKAFLTSSLLCVIKWEGLTIRQQREPYLQREHLFTASCNREDAFNLRFVGRFQVVQQRGQGSFLDVVVPRPVLSQSASNPTMTSLSPCSQNLSTPRRDTVGIPVGNSPSAVGGIRRAREWQCPVAGCRVSAWPFCMMTGFRHPPVCPACGTQGLYRYCPATPRGQPPVLHEGVESEVVPAPVALAIPTQEEMERDDPFT